MYENVMRRGPKAYKNLIRALNESGNVQAAEILAPVYDVARQLPFSNNTSHSKSSSTKHDSNG